MKIREMSPSVFRTETKRPWYRRGIFEKIGRVWSDVLIWVIKLTVDPQNVIRIKALRRTVYRDIDTKMFEACFQLLLNYVEQELAHMNLMTTKKIRWYHDWFPIKDGAKYGLAHLDWEIGLGDESPDQAAAATKIKSLYLWYTVDRPNRYNPWDDIVERDGDVTMTPCNDGTGNVEMHMSDEYSEQLRAAGKIDDEYDAEDTERLMELIKVRGCMWT